ncbi:CLUMA_CG015061, isoform A [Clunio marinus]|uniref:Small ribosomal subunit protein mS26 n=1 Tax=Clunio marinus TaxID=568069 RepID=A0A1J1ISG0_9DIPT|nr:CLUMA_CG015061, isoform A [Clunio marinus]
MLRNLLGKTTIDSLSANGFNISYNPVCVQSVRWRRKPRWIPKAKTKIFRIPNHKPLLPEETHEWLRINNNYKLQMNSVRAFFREEVMNKKKLIAQGQTPADEEAEFERCKSINDEWNQEIANIRDARYARIMKKRCEKLETSLDHLERIKELQMTKIEERVRIQKEKSTTFITRKNIDQAIEHALSNQVDFNFSIDLQGNIYKGDEKPGSVAKKEAN